MPFQVKWIEKALNTTKTLPRLEIDWYAKEGAKRTIRPLWCVALYTPHLFCLYLAKLFFFSEHALFMGWSPSKEGLPVFLCELAF